jgi:glutamate/tyrosine decarboxylase-like PLP-dependent enzyme
VIFADPGVGRLYKHDSPYTYFTSDELHLGEISLECSRAGAAAGALWLTLQVLPLEADDGLGPILAAGLRAARGLADRLAADPDWTLHLRPELDIVTYAPRGGSLSEVDTASERMLHAAMNDPDDPWFLSTLRVSADAFTALHPSHARDSADVRVLRSVLMKPEHELAVDALHRRLGTLAAAGSL